MRREPTVGIVLAGSAAFLNLYSTQPLLPLLARTFRASTFDVGLTITAPAIAVEPPPGTKNFTVPSGVPNYFSNEVGAPHGSGGIVRPAPATSAPPTPSATPFATMCVP